MPQIAALNHVALLLPSVRQAASILEKAGLPIGPEEQWDGEGTREIYVGGPGQGGRLLLMQPVKEGAYARAMAKRGPGLHHIAIDVPELEEFIRGLSGSGWYLHPSSLQSIRKTQTAWLARPGMPTLIEVQQASPVELVPVLVTRLEMPLPEFGMRMFAALGMGALVGATLGGLRIEFGAVRVSLAELLDSAGLPEP